MFSLLMLLLLLRSKSRAEREKMFVYLRSAFEGILSPTRPDLARLGSARLGQGVV